MSKRFFYSDSIADFLTRPADEIIGILSNSSDHDIVLTQRGAWNEQITILKEILPIYAERGSIYFEYNIPRMGRRIDVVVLIDGVVFLLEFKAFNEDYQQADIIQVWDYALDLKNFHEASHSRSIIPILVATDARKNQMKEFVRYDDIVLPVLLISVKPTTVKLYAL